MEYQVLGGLQVRRGGQRVDLGGRSAHRLLAALLVDAPEPVDRETLLERLWGGRPPLSAVAALQVHVSRLRRALEPATSGGSWSVLRTTSGGYQLEVAPEEVDYLRYEHLVRSAQRCSGTDPVAALRHLEDARSLWRGRPWGSWSDEPWLQLEAARLEELQRLADELWADLQLALGRHELVVDRLSAAVEAEPLRERRWRQLMLALYRCGRQADALRAYARLRRELRETLGIEPGDDVAQLEAAILAHDADLDWHAPDDSPARPIPPLLTVALASPFVGRDAEIVALIHEWEEACRGNQRVVALEGEPGIGKTKVVAEFAHRVAATGGRVVYGRCDEHLDVPYQLWVDLIEQLVRHMPDATLAELVAEYGAELSIVVPRIVDRTGSAARPRGSPPDVARLMLTHGVAALVAHATQKAPTLLICEDLHWADNASLSLLRHVASNMPPRRVLVLATYRGSQVAESQPVLDALASVQRHAQVRHLSLDGLDETDVAELLAGALGRKLGSDDLALARTLRRDTAGNAYFLTEVIRDLVERGLSGTGPGEVPLESTWRPPRSVREMVEQRLRQLGRETRRTLAGAAILGQDFDPDIVVAVTGQRHDQVLDAIDAGRSAGLLAEVEERPDRLEFRHGIVYHAIYDDLTTARKRYLHRRAANALSDVYGDEPLAVHAIELAHHWINGAGPDDGGTAARQALRAGKLTLEGLAPESAVVWYREALALCRQSSVRDERLRCHALIGLGTAQRLVGEADSRTVLAEAAQLALELGDTELLVAAALAIHSGWNTKPTVVDLDRVRLLEAALGALDGRDSAPRAELLATLAVELSWSEDLDRRRRLVDDAIAMARRLNEPRTKVTVINYCFEAVYVPDTLGLRQQWAEEAVAAAEDAGDPTARWLALETSAWAAFDAGQFRTVSRILDQLDAIAERLAHPRFDCAFLRACHTLAVATPDEGQAAADEFLRLGQEVGAEYALTVWGTLVCSVLWRRGELAELLPMIELATVEFPEMAAARPALAATYVQMGQRDKARRLLDEERDQEFSCLPYDRSWLGAIAGWAFVAASVDDKGTAQVLYRLAMPFAGQFVLPTSIPDGSMAHYLGRLAAVMGELDTSLAYFETAGQQYEENGTSYWQACNDLELARTLLQRSISRDSERAELLLRRVIGSAGTNGYAYVERAGRRLLEGGPSAR